MAVNDVGQKISLGIKGTFAGVFHTLPLGDRWLLRYMHYKYLNKCVFSLSLGMTHEDVAGLNDAINSHQNQQFVSETAYSLSISCRSDELSSWQLLCLTPKSSKFQSHLRSIHYIDTGQNPSASSESSRGDTLFSTFKLSLTTFPNAAKNGSFPSPDRNSNLPRPEPSAGPFLKPHPASFRCSSKGHLGIKPHTAPKMRYPFPLSQLWSR